MTFRIVILASGSGTLTQAIINAHEASRLPIEIAAVISDKQSEVLARAIRHNIPAFHLPVTGDRSAWDSKLFSMVDELQPDLVVSAGFMRILAPDFVTRFRCINSHPSLLPLFPGAHAVRDALAAHVSETGCTVHWIDSGVDTGPIIAQVTVPINLGDTEEVVHERIKIAERALIVEIIATLAGEEKV